MLNNKEMLLSLIQALLVLRMKFTVIWQTNNMTSLASSPGIILYLAAQCLVTQRFFFKMAPPTVLTVDWGRG